MAKEKPQFVEDESAEIIADIQELAHPGNVFEYMCLRLKGRTDAQSLLEIAATVFEERPGDLFWQNYPPMGGPYDGPESKDFNALLAVIKEEHLTPITPNQSVHSSERVNPHIQTGHACAQLRAGFSERRGVEEYAVEVKTYIFLTEPGERKGNSLAFSQIDVINRTTSRRVEDRFIKGFPPQMKYAWADKTNLIVPQTIERHERPRLFRGE